MFSFATLILLAVHSPSSLHRCLRTVRLVPGVPSVPTGVDASAPHAKVESAPTPSSAMRHAPGDSHHSPALQGHHWFRPWTLACTGRNSNGPRSAPPGGSVNHHPGANVQLSPRAHRPASPQAHRPASPRAHFTSFPSGGPVSLNRMTMLTA